MTPADALRIDVATDHTPEIPVASTTTKLDLRNKSQAHILEEIRALDKSTTTIDLSECGLWRKSCAELLEIMRALPEGLRVLDLSQNLLGPSKTDDELISILQVFCHKSLIRLDLDDDILDREDIKRTLHWILEHNMRNNSTSVSSSASSSSMDMHGRIQADFLYDRDKNQVLLWLGNAILEGKEENFNDFVNIAQSFPRETGSALERLHEQCMERQQKDQVDSTRVAALTLSGTMYAHGLGVTKNITVAVRRYEEAIKLGSPLAMVRLADLYDTRQVINKGKQDALRLYMQAAELGNVRGIFGLARKYERREVPFCRQQDAVPLYERAVALGDTSSMNNLGVMYLHGEVAGKSKQDGITLFEQAATLGNTMAMYNLARMYEFGEVPSKSREDAARLYKKAAELGQKRARIALLKRYTPSHDASSSGTASGKPSSSSSCSSSEPGNTQPRFFQKEVADLSESVRKHQNQYMNTIMFPL